MKRITLGVALAVFGLGAVNWLLAEAPAPAQRAYSVANICDQLQAPINIEKPIDGSPLKDVLEFLADKYGLSFIVDTQAFEQSGVGGGRAVEDTQVRLPKVSHVTLSTVLRFLLGQLNGAYIVRRDYIEITTHEKQLVEAFGAGPYDVASLPPVINTVFDGRQLAGASAELAGQSGKNVVLDPRIPNTDKLIVRATLLNTPVDTAVRVAAELTGQKVVSMDNVYYVTTPDHANALQAEQRAQPTRQQPPQPPAGPSPAAPPGTPKQSY
jgi:hypothetical protein